MPTLSQNQTWFMPQAEKGRGRGLRVEGALCAVAGAPQAPRHGSTGVAAGVGKTHRCTTRWLETERRREREREGENEGHKISHCCRRCFW